MGPRIVTILERDVPVGAPMRNAVIDFSRMTASICALVTDVERGRRPVVGLGFSSNGRYAQGDILRRRILPRVLSADPASLLDDGGGNLDPFAIHARAMTDEKPGGHGERPVAVGALDMAVWDAVAKIEGRPLYRLLADRYHDGRAEATVEVYAAGGYYHPGGDAARLADEPDGTATTPAEEHDDDDHRDA